MPITSPQNEALKEIRKLAGRRWRDKLGEFVAEGEDLVEAADAAGWAPNALYVAAGSGLNGIEVAPHVLATVSQLGSSTRALGVYPQRWAAPAGPLCVALWGVGDPGNVGTVLRSALAFGADSVAVGPGSADPYGHKAVRASMGALFSVPLARVQGARRAARPARRARRPRGPPAGPAHRPLHARRRRRARGAAGPGRRRVRRRRPHPDRPRRLPQRRHGGDCRPLPAD